MIRLCSKADVPAIFEIINDSAQAYKGVIPADVWHEPYMPLTHLEAEIGKGVQFHGYDVDGKLSGVMGIQDIKDVTLIRHAYVRGEARSHGIGRKLLEHVVQLTERPVLIGAWRVARGVMGRALLREERLRAADGRRSAATVRHLLDHP